MKPRLLAAAMAAAALFAGSAPAAAGIITQGQFLQFAFNGVGQTATGCDPADPNGPFCIPSSGTPTEFLDAPAWTFTAAVGGALLTVVDAFESGDRFDVFDFGVLLGSTSLPNPRIPADCGDDPVVCLGTPGMSLGSFALPAGDHSITIVLSQSLSPLGSAYLRVDDDAAAVPVPASIGLVLVALLGAGRARRLVAPAAQEHVA